MVLAFPPGKVLLKDALNSIDVFGLNRCKYCDGWDEPREREGKPKAERWRSDERIGVKRVEVSVRWHGVCFVSWGSVSKEMCQYILSSPVSRSSFSNNYILFSPYCFVSLFSLCYGWGSAADYCYLFLICTQTAMRLVKTSDAFCGKPLSPSMIEYRGWGAAPCLPNLQQPCKSGIPWRGKQPGLAGGIRKQIA